MGKSHRNIFTSAGLVGVVNVLMLSLIYQSITKLHRSPVIVCVCLDAPFLVDAQPRLHSGLANPIPQTPPEFAFAVTGQCMSRGWYKQGPVQGDWTPAISRLVW